MMRSLLGIVAVLLMVGYVALTLGATFDREYEATQQRIQRFREGK